MGKTIEVITQEDLDTLKQNILQAIEELKQTISLQKNELAGVAIANEPDEFLSVTHLSGLLNVSRQTFYNWRKKGLLPAPIKIGQTIRYSKRKVLAALEQKNTKFKYAV